MMSYVFFDNFNLVIYKILGNLYEVRFCLYVLIIFFSIEGNAIPIRNEEISLCNFSINPLKIIVYHRKR